MSHSKLGFYENFDVNKHQSIYYILSNRKIILKWEVELGREGREKKKMREEEKYGNKTFVNREREEWR